MRSFSLIAILGATMAAAIIGCGEPTGSNSSPLHAREEVCPTISVPAFKMGTPDVVLLITGGTNAMLETCNCAGPMPGGTAKRSALIHSYRKAFPHTIVMDAGDAMTTSSVLADSRFADLTNDYLMPAYDAMGYDLLVMRDQEWVCPHDRIAKLMSSSKMKFLSTTVAPIDAVAKLPIVPEVKFQWGSTKVAVLSDLRADWLMFFPQERMEQLRFSPPEVLAQKVRQLKADGYVVVVVTHCRNDDQKQTIADAKPDLVIRGNTTQTVEELMDEDGTPVVKVGDYAYVGVVAMKFSAGKISAIEFRPEIVDDRWPNDNKLSQIYQAYVHSAMRLALDADRKKGIDYVPSEACAQCHSAQYQNWKTTRHSRAWNTLVNVKRTSDPNCLACHTTGFRTEKGFYTIEKTPAKANVNCQDCHRFGLQEHTAGGFDAAKYKITENVCKTCHTAVTDPKFNEDEKKRRQQISCPRTIVR